jgi:tripartite ATP-independent transporter DctM subunit
MIGVLVIALVALIIVGAPIAIALGSAGFLAVLTATDLPPLIVVQRMFSAVDQSTLVTIPFFLLAGRLMVDSGMSERLMNMVMVVFGFIRGGLALVSVGASMFFAGLSGSAISDTAAIGSVAIPSMKRRGYQPEFAGALVSAAGTVGAIIPPSIPFILYAVVAGLSISDLFLAGVIPGVLIGVALMVTAYVMSTRRGYPSEERISWREAWRRLGAGVLPLMMPVIILGGIATGVFTATESAVVAAIYALLVGAFVYRTLTVTEIARALRYAAYGSGAVMFLLAASNVVAWLLTSAGVPRDLTSFMESLTDDKFVFLAIINVVLLLVGLALDTVPAIVMLVPLLAPVAIDLGVDPLQFAVLFVLNLMIGAITPPSAPTLVVGAGIADVSLGRISVAVLPFLAAEIAVLMLVSYVPDLYLWLPRLAG